MKRYGPEMELNLKLSLVRDFEWGEGGSDGQGLQGCLGALMSTPRPTPPGKISIQHPAPPSAPGLARAPDRPDPRSGLACSRIAFRRRARHACSIKCLRAVLRARLRAYARRASAHTRATLARDAHAAG